MTFRTAIFVFGVAMIVLVSTIWLTFRYARPEIFGFYATNLRASLFSGALTLGSFLLAVNTFIIVNLKKEVYEHDLYKKRVQEHRKARPDYKHYGPLKNLSRVLLITIGAAFFSAVLQVTLGMLWEHKASAVICIGSAILVGFGVAAALVLVGRTMKDWFDFLEEAAAIEIASADDEPNVVAELPRVTKKPRGKK